MTSAAASGYLKYELMKYGDVETAQFLFEQNEHGTLTLCNGWDVYLTTNIERSAAIWLDGDTTYSLFGKTSEADIVNMINSIRKGDST